MSGSQLEDLVQRYQDALWFVIGATRQAEATPGRWERACRLSEARAAEALNVRSRLSNEQHHLAPDFTPEERAALSPGATTEARKAQ